MNIPSPGRMLGLLMARNPGTYGFAHFTAPLGFCLMPSAGH